LNSKISNIDSILEEVKAIKPKLNFSVLFIQSKVKDNRKKNV